MKEKKRKKLNKKLRLSKRERGIVTPKRARKPHFEFVPIISHAPYDEELFALALVHSMSKRKYKGKRKG